MGPGGEAAFGRGDEFAAATHWQCEQDQQGQKPHGQGAEQLFHQVRLLQVELGGGGMIVLVIEQQLGVQVEAMLMYGGLGIDVMHVEVHLGELRQQQRADGEERHQRTSSP